MTTSGLAAGVFEIPPDELVNHLLIATGQDSSGPVNASLFLDYLNLSYLEIDFARDLSSEHLPHNFTPRALLSFPDHLVAADTNLSAKRLRFSVLHEIAHFVLPAHQHSLYLCDDADLSSRTNFKLEAQANQVAASLMFKGGQFTLAANSTTPSASFIKELAIEYDASFEATVRRLVEKSLQPIMLAVFKQTNNQSIIDPTQQPDWEVRYCITSPAFRTRYFSGITGSPPEEIVKSITESGRDFSSSITTPIHINSQEGEVEEFSTEWFSNTYNIMALIMTTS